MNAPSNSPPCENIDNCLNRDPESVENSDVAAEVESVLEGTTEDEQWSAFFVKKKGKRWKAAKKNGHYFK